MSNSASSAAKVALPNVSIKPFDFLHPLIPRPFTPVVRGIGAVLESVPLLREIAGSLLISAERSAGTIATR